MSGTAVQTKKRGLGMSTAVVIGDMIASRVFLLPASIAAFSGFVGFIPPGGEIGEEVHDHVDQTLVFVDGDGEAIFGSETSPVRAGSLAFVPEGTQHNFRNTGSGPLRLYTGYAPPEHAPGTVHKTKAEADAAEAHGRPGGTS